MIENIAIATVTEMQNFFERYLAMVQEGNEIIVTKNGKGGAFYSARKGGILFNGFSCRNTERRYRFR